MRPQHNVQQADGTPDKTISAVVDRERCHAQFAARNHRCAVAISLEALHRALDALKHRELKLSEREIEAAIERLERIAP